MPKSSLETPGFIITGCGRSGTGYISSCLDESGIPCSHERVFSPKETHKTFSEIKNGEGEASWYAAPFLQDAQKMSAKVIHIVRDPLAVANSFYRLGVFSVFGWRNLIQNPSPVFISKKLLRNPSFFYKRIQHTMLHQSFIKNHTKILHERTEVDRCLRYWHDWNMLVERNCNSVQLPYLRVRLEDIENEGWEKISTFLGIEKEITRSIEKNKKLIYPRRSRLITESDMNEKTRALASRYGYNYGGTNDSGHH